MPSLFSKRIKILIILFIIILVAGLVFLLFPVISNFIADIQENKAIYEWESTVESTKSFEKSINDSISIETTPGSISDDYKNEDFSLKTFDNVVNNFYSSTSFNELLTFEELFPLKIEIPKIGIKWLVNEGTDTKTLKKGPGHYISTKLPGQIGRCAIAGHRTTYGAPFNQIDLLEIGDFIYLEGSNGLIFLYIVTDTQNVKPSDVFILEGSTKRELILTTCEPKFSAAKRLVVIAELIEIIPVEMRLYI